jgi:hypothetical protein
LRGSGGAVLAAVEINGCAKLLGFSPHGFQRFSFWKEVALWRESTPHDLPRHINDESRSLVVACRLHSGLEIAALSTHAGDQEEHVGA